MADERRRGELQLVEQLTVIDDQVEPAVERVHRLGITASGAWVLRRIDGIGFGKAGDECAIGGEPPGSMQIDERRTAAADFHFRLDAVLP